jgi:hypothetical protein
METSLSSDQHNQQSGSDQVFYGILDHYYRSDYIYEDPESSNTQVRMTVGVIVFANTPDHNAAKYLLRKNIRQIVEDFEKQLMSRLYK